MKLIVIGAGIAGLSAGIYGRLNGFDTEIYEMHTQPGGECTGWKRNGYYFDGCIHWLLGTKRGSSLNKVWREVGALDDTVKIINHDFFYSYEEDETRVFLYSDVKSLKSHFMEISPEDGDNIDYLCKAIEALKCMEMPTRKAFDRMNGLDYIGMMIKMFPAIKYLRGLDKISVKDFAGRFRSPLLQKTLTTLIPSYFKATALVSTIASMAYGDAGWPEGGSLSLARRVEKKYESLGGKIFYKSRVKKIITQGEKATGILLEDGTERFADYVVSSADGHATLFDMLDGRYLDDNLKTLYSDRKNYPTYTSVQVSLGVRCDLSKHPHASFFNVPSGIDGGSKKYHHIGFRHYCFDKTLMAGEKSALITHLNADFDWWKERYENKELYRSEKERIAEAVKIIAQTRYPELKDRIETVDVATPMTYVRYCNAWQGAWMAWANTPSGKIKFVSGRLPGLTNFFLTGQWTLPPGGLPTAVVTGRWVIQRICHLEKKKFSPDN